MSKIGYKNLFSIHLAFILISTFFDYALLHGSPNAGDGLPSLGVLASSFNRIDLHEMAAELGIFSFNFNEKSVIDEEARLIRNIWTVRDQKWLKLDSAPLPKVYYDFGFYSRKGKALRQQGRKLRDIIISLGSVPINSPIAMKPVRDKIKFSSIMEENRIRHPHTQEYSEESLLDFTDNHKNVFLKPVHGSKGNGIVEIKKYLDIYLLIYQVKSGDSWIKKWIQSTKSRLVDSVNFAVEELEQKSKAYLMQEGIRVLHFDDQRTDFRVSTHRNGLGEVEVVSALVRVGGNISQNGKIASDKEVLQYFEQEYGYSCENLKADC
ncbi:MAG: YheC/YheD family protein [Oligoflexales bacterium]